MKKCPQLSPLCTSLYTSIEVSSYKQEPYYSPFREECLSGVNDHVVLLFCSSAIWAILRLPSLSIAVRAKIVALMTSAAGCPVRRSIRWESRLPPMIRNFSYPLDVATASSSSSTVAKSLSGRYGSRMPIFHRRAGDGRPAAWRSPPASIKAWMIPIGFSGERCKKKVVRTGGERQRREKICQEGKKAVNSHLMASLYQVKLDVNFFAELFNVVILQHLNNDLFGLLPLRMDRTGVIITASGKT